jgi:hypothetical protein
MPGASGFAHSLAVTVADAPVHGHLDTISLAVSEQLRVFERLCVSERLDDCVGHGQPYHQREPAEPGIAVADSTAIVRDRFADVFPDPAIRARLRRRCHT